jgi:hypothetical protein
LFENGGEGLVVNEKMKKCIMTRLGVVVGEYFFYPTNSHVKNDNLFASRV